MSTLKKVANTSVCFTANTLALGIDTIKDMSFVITEACNLSVAGLLTLKNASHRKLGGKKVDKTTFGDNYQSIHDKDYRRLQVFDGRSSVKDYLKDVAKSSGIEDINEIIDKYKQSNPLKTA